MPNWSEVWGVEVRDEIAREFTRPDGSMDDNLAGLHEIRARLAEDRDDVPRQGDPSQTRRTAGPSRPPV